MKVQYLIASESFSLDDNTGRLSIFHILDRIQVAATPFLLQSTVLTALFEKEEGGASGSETCDAFIKLNGKVLSQTVFRIGFEGVLLNRTFTTIQSIMIPEPGLLMFTVEKKNKVLGSWSVEVVEVGSAKKKARIAKVPQVKQPPVRKTVASTRSKSARPAR